MEIPLGPRTRHHIRLCPSKDMKRDFAASSAAVDLFPVLAVLTLPEAFHNFAASVPIMLANFSTIELPNVVAA